LFSLNITGIDETMDGSETLKVILTNDFGGMSEYKLKVNFLFNQQKDSVVVP
jgi:hypothetical protein